MFLNSILTFIFALIDTKVAKEKSNEAGESEENAAANVKETVFAGDLAPDSAKSKSSKKKKKHKKKRRKHHSEGGEAAASSPKKAKC